MNSNETSKLLDMARKTCSPETDAELSRRLGIQRSAVSNWRNGRSLPDTIQSAKIAEITGVPLPRVLGIVGEARAISESEKKVWRKLAAFALTILLMTSTSAFAFSSDSVKGAYVTDHYAKFCRFIAHRKFLTSLAFSPIPASLSCNRCH